MAWHEYGLEGSSGGMVGVWITTFCVMKSRIRFFNSDLTTPWPSILRLGEFQVRKVGYPNCVGMSQEEAEAAIAASDFVLGSVTYDTSDTVEVGHVISQYPEPVASSWESPIGVSPSAFENATDGDTETEILLPILPHEWSIFLEFSQNPAPYEYLNMIDRVRFFTPIDLAPAITEVDIDVLVSPSMTWHHVYEGVF